MWQQTSEYIIKEADIDSKPVVTTGAGNKEGQYNNEGINTKYQV